MTQTRPRPRRLIVALAGSNMRRATTDLRANNNATPVQTNVVMLSLPRKFERVLCSDLRESGKPGFLREGARNLSIWRRCMEGRGTPFRPVHSLESLNGRCCADHRHRRLCARRRGACLASRGRYAGTVCGLTLDDFRPRATHARFGSLPPLPRRTAPVESPGPRDRGPGCIPDDGAGHRADRHQHDGARQRTQRGVTGPMVLRRCKRGCEQQQHGERDRGFGHGRGPSK